MEYFRFCESTLDLKFESKMSWRESITEDEMELVEKLKSLLIKDCTPKMLEDDSLFYRFMKARDFNLKNAEHMLRNHIAWRKEYHIDTILTDFKPPEIMQKYSAVTLLGFDKDGDIVKYLDVGRTDTKGIINSVKKTDIIKFNLMQNELDFERLKQHSDKLKRTVRKISYVYNFDKMSFARSTNKKAIELMVLSTKMFQDNYPEVIKRVFIIHASVYFTIVFSILRQFVAPNVIEKIQVFGADGYQESLVELIDPDILPAFLGGNRTDPDGNPNCYSFVAWGKDVPEEYYARKSERTLSKSPGVKKLTVTRFAKSDIRFDVTEPDSLLEWEFETKSRDIGFGVYFKRKDSSEEESKPVELVPKQRIDTCMEPETGVYKCKKAGTYIIVFDNSYSWLHPKEIFYRTRIIGPSDEENSQWT